MARHNIRAASGCFGSSVGKPHKTGAKAFHFRSRFTGTLILVVEEGKLVRRNDKSTLLPNLGNRESNSSTEDISARATWPIFPRQCREPVASSFSNRCSGYIPQRSVLITQDNSQWGPSVQSLASGLLVKPSPHAPDGERLFNMESASADSSRISASIRCGDFMEPTWKNGLRDPRLSR
jgi:hypothetical protein